MTFLLSIMLSISFLLRYLQDSETTEISFLFFRPTLFSVYSTLTALFQPSFPWTTSIFTQVDDLSQDLLSAVQSCQLLPPGLSSPKVQLEIKAAEAMLDVPGQTLDGQQLKVMLRSASPFWVPSDHALTTVQLYCIFLQIAVFRKNTGVSILRFQLFI